MRDTLFSKPNDLVDFTFDKSVVEVFDDMVRRSVPGYQSMLEMIGLATQTYGQANSHYYDLGASTGATSLAIALNNKQTDAKIIAVDNSPEMVEKCRHNLSKKTEHLEVVCADISDVPIENASLVVLNLTLQFIEPGKRQHLIDRIYQGLNPGGALIVSEKLHFSDATQQQTMTNLHLDFKRANGYSDLEIAAKRQSIENVLITDDEKTHLARFHQAGFNQSIKHFQCLNFASFLAIK